jgi:hypothetical protein
MNRLTNFATHTAKVFYITVLLGATVSFESPQSATGELVINNYN